ncbi:MAG: hypothetical protein JWQ71_2981 [Pedosphaera sp.]|nr:hypothetical protein [Pedosphaera sp.]
MDATYPKVGCCGFRLTKRQYAERFPVVEVQQTFYQPPKKIETLKRWRAEVPEDFEFTLKAWQLITHPYKSPTYRRLTTQLSQVELEQCGSFQPTPMVKEAWQTTRACAEALSAKLILFQCPATFSPTLQNITNMRRFFESIKRDDMTLLWEPRGRWPDSVIEPLCRELNLVHAVDPFLNRTVTPEFVYYRLHGGKDFKQIFSDTQLRELVGRLPACKPAYVMFNNINMLEDAERFQELVQPLRFTQDLAL